MSEPLGELVFTSTTEITGQSLQDNPPFSFGAFVTAGKENRCAGVVYNVETTSIDPNRRPSALGLSEDDYARNYPQYKMLLRSQFQAVLIGTFEGDTFRYGFPATPPTLHAQVHGCTPDEIREIGRDLGVLRLLFASGKSSPEELLLCACQRILDACGRDRDTAVRLGKALSDLYRDDYDTLRRCIHRLELWLNG